MYTIRALKWYGKPEDKQRVSEFAIDGTWYARKNNDGSVLVYFEPAEDSRKYHKDVSDYDEAEALAQRIHEERLKNYLTPMRIGKEEEHYESTYSYGEGGCVTPSGVTRTKVSPT